LPAINDKNAAVGAETHPYPFEHYFGRMRRLGVPSTSHREGGVSLVIGPVLVRRSSASFQKVEITSNQGGLLLRIEFS
jgi:hypothetical protein